MIEKIKKDVSRYDITNTVVTFDFKYIQRMKNIVDADPEIWYGLTEIANFFGYKSRQELVERILIETVNQYPEQKFKGIEKANIMVTAKAKLVELSGPTKHPIKPIVIPMMQGGNNRYKLKLKTGEEKVVFAPTLLDAGKQALNDKDLTVEGFWEHIESKEIL